MRFFLSAIVIFSAIIVSLVRCGGAGSTATSTSSTTYTVTVSTDGNETPMPNTQQTVNSGSALSFSVTASGGYTNGTVGGTCTGGSWVGSTYTTGAITGDCTVNFTAVVSSTTYTVTPSSGDGNESPTPNTAQTVAVGATKSFSVSVTSGFTLATTPGGTCPTGSWSGSTYTTGAITGDCTVIFETTARSLLALTSTTGTTITSYFMNPLTSQLGSSACNADYYPGTSGTHCTSTTETCDQVSENTTTCQAARTALGLSGNWLNFSCNVILGLAYKSGASYVTTTNYASATYVSMTTQDLPTYQTNYYPTSSSYDFTANNYTITGLFSALNITFSTPFPDPGVMAQPSSAIIMYVPITPTQCTGSSCNNGSSSTNLMNMGAVGMAINGAYVFSSMASQTDNIFAEAGSFDQCQGHPAGTQYHYHNEPVAISYNDDNLIGVMMDGYWIYGRKDSDSSIPGSLANEEAGASTSATNTIYYFGGHVGALPNANSTTQFHYHATEWIGCYDETSGSVSGYTYQDNGVTYDTYNSSNFSSTTGPASPAASGNTYCKGAWIDAWFLTGHGNGGVFETPSDIANGGVPGAHPVWTSSTSTFVNKTTSAPAVTWSCGGSGSSACMSQTTAGERYYYGTPGSCPSCN